MAGRFVYWMNVSLDLFIEREAGEHGDIEGPSWIRLSEPLHREFSARARAMPAMVEGRIVYEMMDPFWPNARTNESLPGFLANSARSGRISPRCSSRARARRRNTTRASSAATTTRSNSSPCCGGRRTATSGSAARLSPRSCCRRTCSTNCCCSHTRSCSAADARFSTRSTNPSNSTSWNSVHSTRA